jgi:hypothetical protein
MPETSLLETLRWRVLSSYKVNKLRTWIYRTLNPSQAARIVFVFGCQRSGTTMLRSFIGFDPRVDDQGEGDPPYFWQGPEEDLRYLRLLPDEEVERLAARCRSEVLLIKPLHDSQRAAHLLLRFPGSKGLWIYRHYHEVILSHLTYYRGRYEPLPYLKDLLELNEASWKAENLSQEMRDFILQHRHLVTTPTAGFALFWLARNSLLFSQIAAHPDLPLATLGYSDLIGKASSALAFLGDYIGLELDPRYARFPEHRDRQKPLPDPIPPVLQDACEAMLARLRSTSIPLP